MPDWECLPCGQISKNQRNQPTCFMCHNVMTVQAAAVVAAAPVVRLNWTNHRNKHCYPRGAGARGDAATKAGTEHGDAKYASGVAIQSKETECLQALGNFAGIVETNKQIGWHSGEDCTKIQIYVSADNSFHGHPITDDLTENRGGVIATL